MDKYISLFPDLMKEKDVSKMDLVRKAGIAHGTAAKIAKGELNISMTTALKVTDLLGVTLADCISENGNTQTE